MTSPDTTCSMFSGDCRSCVSFVQNTAGAIDACQYNDDICMDSRVSGGTTEPSGCSGNQSVGLSMRLLTSMTNFFHCDTSSLAILKICIFLKKSATTVLNEKPILSIEIIMCVSICFQQFL